MDLNLSSDDLAFRGELRSFLAANLPADMRADKGVPFNKVPTGNR